MGHGVSWRVSFTLKFRLAVDDFGVETRRKTRNGGNAPDVTRGRERRAAPIRRTRRTDTTLTAQSDAAGVECCALATGPQPER